MLDYLDKLFKAAWDWYYDLPTWQHRLVNWFGIHGGITALAVLLGAIVSGSTGAWIGYGLGAGFYIVKEVVAWKVGGSKWPSLDQIGDALGPVIVGLGVALLVS